MDTAVQEAEAPREAAYGVALRWVIPDDVFIRTIRQVAEEKPDFVYRDAMKELSESGYTGFTYAEDAFVPGSPLQKSNVGFEGCWNECFWEKEVDGETDTKVVRCLIGEVLYRCLPEEAWEKIARKRAGSNICGVAGGYQSPAYLSERMLEAASAAQAAQDRGGTWADAHETFKDTLAGYDRLHNISG